MLSISSEYELSLNENSNQLIKAKITFADNTVRQLTGDDIVSCDFDQQVSSDSSFDIGTAIIGQMTITLNNHDGRFDACDFTKAQFVVWLGKQLSKGTEWIQRGVYTANQPDSYNGTIAISALDNMSKFEKPFRTFLASVGALQGANASVRTLLTDMCRHCGVTWADSGDKAFDTKFEYGYVDSNATCRQALAYACQALCVNASITNDGRLRTVWYDSAPFEAESDLDGGQFDSAKPYATGASKDGGNFTDYSSGASADGGTFFTNRNVHRLYAFSNITVNTDDVVITGVRVTERSVTVGSKTTNGGTYTVGTEGYVLDVSNNPLIIPGTGKSVADRIGAKVIGLRFRPFSGKHICDPSLEAGDCAYIIDRKQNVYKTYVTRVKYSVNGGMTVSCGAKSASRNSADNAGASTSAVVRARNELHQELGIRDETIKNLGESLANASGLYHTEAKQPDGSTVYYLHDKPTTGQSQIIYKVTASGIGISTDAGKTYATGLSADGTAVLNRIYAIGINADYIGSGSIDAKRVAIRNLLSIGDDTNSVSVSSSGISFMSGGVKDALTIKPKSYKMVTVSKSGYNGSPIWEATGVASDPKTYGFDCTEKAQAFIYAGKTRVSIGVRVDFYANGYRHILGGRYDPLEYEIDTSKDTQSFTVQSQPFIVAFTLKKSSEAGSNGLPCYNISVSLVLIANGVHVCINGIDVFYSSPGYGGEISQKSTGAFLNRENFVKEVTDSFPLTCQVRIPVAMNNIIRDYVLTFEKGLLVGWGYYTPADSQYKGY